MVEIVYVLGYSGSGKTTAVQCLEMLIGDIGENWSTTRFNDYRIMYEWFTHDSDHQWFRPTEHEGFDILIPEIYDRAMIELICKIREHKPGEREFMIIDFARCEYSKSFTLLGRDLLQNAYFLFLDAELETCIQRIQSRILNPQSIDDHFVPQSVFDCYTHQRTQYINSTVSRLIDEYGVSEKKVTIVDNSSGRSFENLYERLGDFVKSIVLTKTEAKILVP